MCERVMLMRVQIGKHDRNGMTKMMRKKEYHRSTPSCAFLAPAHEGVCALVYVPLRYS